MINVIIKIEGPIGSGKSLIKRMIKDFFEKEKFSVVEITTTPIAEFIAVSGDENVRPST
jgi:thymidylate kinase